MYSQAVALKCEKLVSDLSDLIVQELLNAENVTHFYLDSIEFENIKLREACEGLLVASFDSIYDS